MSGQFGFVDIEHIAFPTVLSIDYIRVYQHPDNINYGCDPVDFPTQSYIEQCVKHISWTNWPLLKFHWFRYEEAYYNPLLTTWVDDYKQPIPKNSFLGEC